MSKTFVYDEFSPEDTAMMQALYSRSAESVETHVEKVKSTGSGNFMEKFYVGYGHASIADCGSTTIFIEDVSMLVAKAVQDWPLYSGQETSSRYINLGERRIEDPINTPESKAVFDAWMNFYKGSQDKVCDHLKSKYPRKPEEDEKTYDRAIKARSFDILRGFLPAGVTTQLSWHTNLRQAHDKLALLRYHPLAEVREVAAKIAEGLKVKYSHSFSHPEFEAQEAYRKDMTEKYTYYDRKDYDGDFIFETKIENGELEQYRDIFETRPEKTGLPHFLAELGPLTFSFLLDFGSFRDIQRHRNGVCRMPLLTTKHGFNQWYLDQLPEDLRSQAEALIQKQIKAIAALPGSETDRQYAIAMGFNVTCKVSYALPAAAYTIELRSGRMVHPTLRRVAHLMAKAVGEKLPAAKLNCDFDPDDWDIRRGSQDIKEKEPSAN